MKHIILTPEQSQIVQQAEEAVEVRDERGRTIALLTQVQVTHHVRGQALWQQ